MYKNRLIQDWRPGNFLQESVVDKGILYIVATPIGNTGDISARALEVLASVDLVAAEDTRHSGKLLKHLGVTTMLKAYHDFSDAGAEKYLLGLLGSGKSIALISDAGTPLIADPGYRLVLAARQAGFEVLPVPGPSALLAAISVAGLPTDRFAFEGFLPAKEVARNKQLKALKDEARTLIFYEAPHRLKQSLQSLHDEFGATRRIFIAREMTKRFEEHFCGDLAQSLDWLESNENAERGELVLVVAGQAVQDETDENLASAMRLFSLLREDLSLKRAVAIAAEYCGVRKNELYERALAAEASKDGKM